MLVITLVISLADRSRGPDPPGIVTVEKCQVVKVHGTPSPGKEVKVYDCGDVEVYPNSRYRNNPMSFQKDTVNDSSTATER